MDSEIANRKQGQLDVFERFAWDLSNETPFASVYVEDDAIIDETTGEETTEQYYEFYFKVRQLEDGGDIYDLIMSKVTLDGNASPTYEDTVVRAYEHWQLFPDGVRNEIVQAMLLEGVLV